MYPNNIYWVFRCDMLKQTYVRIWHSKTKETYFLDSVFRLQNHSPDSDNEINTPIYRESCRQMIHHKPVPIGVISIYYY